MNWILEHLQLVLAIAGAFALWLNQRRDAKNAAKGPSRPVQPATMADADDAERARKIREEIMRKIAGRRESAEAPVTMQPREEERKFQFPPLVRPVPPLDTFGGPGRAIIRRSEPVAVEPPVLPRAESEEAVLARQERLAEQMRELEAKRTATLRRAAVETQATQAAEGVLYRAASSVRRDLREPRTLRHAIILREVLGTPVGLR